MLKVKVKVKIILGSVGQSVLVSGAHLGPTTNFSFSLKFSLDSCGFCYFIAPWQTRGRVCNLLLLPVLASAVPLGSESSGTQYHILLSQFLRLHQPGGPGPRIYIPQEQGGPDIPKALRSLLSPLTTRRAFNLNPVITSLSGLLSPRCTGCLDENHSSH
jgi:hypothetical protein